MQKIFFLFFFLIPILPNLLNAKTLTLEEIYEFNSMNETGDEACLGAEEKVKSTAIRKIAGVTISQQAIERCKFTKDSEACEFREITIRSLGKAKITKFKVLEVAVELSKTSGHHQCRLKAEVEVKKIKNIYPNFDFDLKLNGQVFKAYNLDHCKKNSLGVIESKCPLFDKNENLEIFITPLEDMYISIFLWMPYSITNKYKFKKIFPTVFSSESDSFAIKNKKLTIPPSNQFPKFKLRFPSLSEEQTVEEHLWVIGTNPKINFLEEYTWTNFNKKIIEIYESKSNKIRERKDFYVIQKIIIKE